MKNIIGILFIIGSISYAYSHDGQADKEIYNALEVQAVDLTPGMAGAYKFEKKVGGLSCIKTGVVYPGAEASYTCSLGNHVDAQKIYDALNTEETYDDYDGDLYGFYEERKEVANLSCKKESMNWRGTKPRYSCLLK